jgi:hypothetical protein
MNEDLVWDDGGTLCVIRSEAVFGVGYNVYERDGDRLTKVSPLNSYFTTLERAQAWAAERAGKAGPAQ